MQIAKQHDGTIWLAADTEDEQVELGALHVMLIPYGAAKMLQGRINWGHQYYEFERGHLGLIPDHDPTSTVEIHQVCPKPPLPPVPDTEWVNGVEVLS